MGTEDGGCLRRCVTIGHYRGHLQGRFGLGIYLLLEDGTCLWAGVDIDTDDVDSALRLLRLLADAGLPAVLFRSRQKGYHVVVFMRGQVRASDIRAILRHYVAEVGLPARTEIFPKVDAPTPNSKAPGGYLRLPYPAALPDPGRHPRVKPDPGKRTALDPQSLQPLSLEAFLDLAEGSLVAPDHVRALAEELADEEGAALSRGESPELPDDPAEFGVSPAIAALIRQGWTRESKYPSRSEAQLAVTDALLQAGHSEDVVIGVLTCPRYGIAARALEQSPARRTDALARCLAKARARLATFPASVAGSLTPSLHRRLVALQVPPLAWPVVAEILATTDRATGLSLVTTRSLARKLGRAPSTVYRAALIPLREADVVEAVPLARAGGRWGRVAYRVVGARTPFSELRVEALPRSEHGSSRT